MVLSVCMERRGAAASTGASSATAARRRSGLESLAYLSIRVHHSSLVAHALHCLGQKFTAPWTDSVLVDAHDFVLTLFARPFLPRILELEAVVDPVSCYVIAALVSDQMSDAHCCRCCRRDDVLAVC